MRLTCEDIKGFKNRQEAFACLTAYTTSMAQSLMKYVDLILVGDSVGTVLYGMPDTTGVTLDMMIEHGRAVMRSNPEIPVIVDMPYGTYEESAEQALVTAQRLMSECGCHGVKLEGGTEMKAQIAAITRSGIPLMGHVGLQPQSVIKDGGYKIKGRNPEQVAKLLEDIHSVEEAGAFSIVIEGTVADVAAEMTKTVSIPTIGIGASGECDGQILVVDDLLATHYGHIPKFVTPYISLRELIEDAVSRYAEDVRARRFPTEQNLYR